MGDPSPDVRDPFRPPTVVATFLAFLNQKRPTGVTLLAVLQFIGGAVWLLLAVGLMAAAAVDPSQHSLIADLLDIGPSPLSALLGVIAGALSALQFRCGVGLWKMEIYGRGMQLVFSWIGLLAFPPGTLVSAVILFYLRKPGIRILFAGKPLGELLPEEIAQVEALADWRTSAVVAGAVAVGIYLTIAVAGIIMRGIAIPGLLNARTSWNETSAIGALRAINRAQRDYLQRCGGYAPDLQALATVGLSLDVTSSNSVLKSGYIIIVEPDATATWLSKTQSPCERAVDAYFARADPTVYPESVNLTDPRHFAIDTRGHSVYVNAFTAVPNPIPPLTGAVAGVTESR